MNTPQHPYPQGTRVRHHGEQYAGARTMGTATVAEARPAHGSYEYRVLRDHPLVPGGDPYSWWDADATIFVRDPLQRKHPQGQAHLQAGQPPHSQPRESPLHPRVSEAVEQLDAMILNGDYFLDQGQLNEVDFYVKRWARVHASHLRDLEAGVYGEDAPKPPPEPGEPAEDIRLLVL